MFASINNSNFINSTFGLQNIDQSTRNEKSQESTRLNQARAEIHSCTNPNYAKGALLNLMSKFDEKLTEASSNREKNYVENFFKASQELSTYLHNFETSSPQNEKLVSTIQNWQSQATDFINQEHNGKNAALTENSAAGLLKNLQNMFDEIQDNLSENNDDSFDASFLNQESDSTHLESSTRSANLYSSNSYAAPQETTAQHQNAASGQSSTAGEREINMIAIMMSLMLCGYQISNIAMDSLNEFNNMLKDFSKEAEQFNDITNQVNQFLKSVAAQMTTVAPNNSKSQSFSWDGCASDTSLITGTVKPDSNDKGAPSYTDSYSLYDLVNGKGSLTGIPDWKDRIALDSSNNNALLLSFDASSPEKAAFFEGYGIPVTNGKAQLSCVQLNKLLNDFGKNLKEFTGGNISTFDNKGFSNQASVDALVKIGMSANDNLNSSMSTNVTKLSALYAVVNSLVGNLTTNLSNLLSNFMKLESI